MTRIIVLLALLLLSVTSAAAAIIHGFEPVWEEGARSAGLLPGGSAGGFTDPTIGMEFVAVPGGCFQMGCNRTKHCYDDEKPVHEVCVSRFAIGKFEVTQGQWQQIMGSNPSHFISCGYDCPVEKVSWNDVQEFIIKLSRQSGISYRLPTEAEWEYAARSGGKPEMYSGSDDFEAVAWYDDNKGSKPHSVGQKQANGLGIFDMSGNVWEWVNDCYDCYTSERQQDPKGPVSGSYRVIRGGGWNISQQRTTNRDYYPPETNNYSLGFRLIAQGK